MYKISATLLLFFLSMGYQKKDEVKITFNSNNEEREYAYLSDTAIVRFIPAKHTSSLYLLHNISVTFEGVSNAKEQFRQNPSLIPDSAPSKNPIIKIPLKNYMKSNLNDGKVYIDIESVQKIENGKTGPMLIPKSQLDRTFSVSIKPRE